MADHEVDFESHHTWSHPRPSDLSRLPSPLTCLRAHIQLRLPTLLSNTTGRASMSAPTADMEGFRIVFASQGLLTRFSKRAATTPEEASRVVRWDIAGNSAELRWSGGWKPKATGLVSADHT